MISKQQPFAHSRAFQYLIRSAVFFSIATALVAQPTVSLSPTSGSGLSRMFTATYTDPAYYGNLTLALFLVNTTLNGDGGCYLWYNPQNNGLYLTDDHATSWQGPITPGSQSNLENSQCVLSGAASSASGSGTTVVVNFAIGFKTTPSFQGQMYTWLYASNNAGQSSG